ncbi:MAG: acetylxylan esterase [Phycisphaeraceae bacterium]|nr:MAG: acetylxylan esterase [Phycisphaeraceae bacterium]
MIEPDDFGLSHAATLAHVTDATPPPSFSVFWNAWRDETFALEPRLRSARPDDADPADPSATHQFTGLRHHRIGCTHLRAPGVPRAGVVALHGYRDIPPLAQDAQRWAPLSDRGIDVLLVRLRGFPGSTLDAPPAPPGTPLFTRGLESAFAPTPNLMDWHLPRAIADAAAAYLALQSDLHDRAPHAPVYLSGDSFGAGIAVIAAAQLAHRADVPRLALSLPSLADWPFRLAIAHPTPGSITTHARDGLASHPGHAAELTDALLLTDASLHARAVRGHVLCMLALRDDAVPAPTQASLFNALASTPAERTRFVVPFGHAEAGLANARLHAAFERRRFEFLDPATDPASD